MNRIAIITIHKGDEKNIIKTCISIDQQILKPNLHLVILNKKITKIFLNNKKYRKIISGKDNSIYSAMNLGLELTKKYYIIFLNSGDTLISKRTLYDLRKFLFPNYCLQFKTVLKFDNLKFYPKKIFFEKKSYLAHPSFIRPPIKNTLKKFDLRTGAAADMIWIKKNIKIYNIRKISYNSTIHYLGGITTNPSIKSIKFFFKSGWIFFIKEIIKYIIKNILGIKLYYKLIYFKKFNNENSSIR